MSTQTITIKGFIVFSPSMARLPSVYGSPYRFTAWDPRTPSSVDSDDVFVREHTMTVDVPADFDPRHGMVESLQAKKRKLQADFHDRVTAIEREISKLQALEFDGSAA